MSSEVKILRLSTGEDVIAKVGENDQGVSLNKAFVIIPQQCTRTTCSVDDFIIMLLQSDTIALSKDKVFL